MAAPAYIGYARLGRDVYTEGAPSTGLFSAVGEPVRIQLTIDPMGREADVVLHPDHAYAPSSAVEERLLLTFPEVAAQSS